MSGCALRPATASARLCHRLPVEIAHRGGTEKALENTVGAFRSAGAAGVTRWETDVRFDRAGVPVILHDATVDRVSPRTGKVSELDVAGGKVPTDDGQHVPTLREVYAEAVRFHATVLTELKVMPTAVQWPRVAAEIDRSIGRAAVVLISFDPAIVRAARQHVPGAPTGLLSKKNGGTGPPAAYGGNLLRAHDRITAGQARAAVAAGNTLFLWTPDERKNWSRIAGWPVTWVITNRPIAYRAWADARCRVRAPDAGPVR